MAKCVKCKKKLTLIEKQSIVSGPQICTKCFVKGWLNSSPKNSFIY